jgi:hypothetical protein
MRFRVRARGGAAVAAAWLGLLLLRSCPPAAAVNLAPTVTVGSDPLGWGDTVCLTPADAAAYRVRLHPPLSHAASLVAGEMSVNAVTGES